MSSQSLFVQGSKTGYASIPGLPQNQLLVYDDTASTAGSGGAIGFGANTGSSQRTWIAAIESRRDSATSNASNYAGSLVFYTRPAQSPPEERLRINSGGDIVFGGGQSGVNRNFYFDGALNKASRIIFREAGTERWLIGHGAASENGNFEIYSANGNNFVFTRAGNFTAAGTVTANSDITLKTNVNTITHALDKVLALRGVMFDRISTGNHEMGVIAQEVELVVPELVLTDENGIKSVAYGNTVALLIEAVKEQQQQIEQLKKRLV
jgi:hypothetical protein